jgi:hypothetical protein
MLRLNRSFLRRAVRYMVSRGIRQFLDIGSGIPTVGNVHEVAQEADPVCRVVYVDKERVAVTHSNLLLRDNDRALAIQADVRDPEDILGRPEVGRLLDLDKPVGLLTLLLWHFVPDSADPWGLAARYRDAIAPGSYFALTHGGADHDRERVARATDELHQRGADEIHVRSHTEVVRMFDGFEVLEPGVVGCAAWRPEGSGDFSDDPMANVLIHTGVGRKPG